MKIVSFYPRGTKFKGSTQDTCGFVCVIISCSDVTAGSESRSQKPCGAKTVYDSYPLDPLCLFYESCFVWIDSTIQRIFRKSDVRGGFRKGNRRVFLTNYLRYSRPRIMFSSFTFAYCEIVLHETDHVFSIGCFVLKCSCYTKVMDDRFHGDRKSQIVKVAMFPRITREMFPLWFRPLDESCFELLMEFYRRLFRYFRSSPSCY